MRTLISILFALQMSMPAWAQDDAKGPLNYSLKVYGSILAIALLGGLASWWGKVSKGHLPMWNISALVGELCISAFAGLIAFYLCDYFALHQGLTAAIVGVSGHAGTKGINWVEGLGQRFVEKKLNIEVPKE